VSRDSTPHPLDTREQKGKELKNMFCNKCGKEIDDSAVICVNCGVATINMQKQNLQNQPQNPQNQPIIINNSSSSSASAVASVGRIRRHRSFLFDVFMIFITGGLWIIWMIIRPKYY